MILCIIYVELITSIFTFPIFANKLGAYEKINITKLCFTGSILGIL